MIRIGPPIVSEMNLFSQRWIEDETRVTVTQVLWQYVTTA